MAIVQAKHEYAFDVKLAAVVRVKASSPRRAVDIIQGLKAIDLDWRWGETVHITEASVDDCSPELLEIDGVEV